MRPSGKPLKHVRSAALHFEGHGSAQNGTVLECVLPGVTTSTVPLVSAVFEVTLKAAAAPLTRRGLLSECVSAGDGREQAERQQAS